MRNVATTGLLAGLLLNLLGWLGNNTLLEPLWEAAALRMTPFAGYGRTLWNEALGLAPDFVYGLGLAWLYQGLIPRYGAGWPTALRSAGLVWAVGAATTYLASANYGLIPPTVSLATTLLAAGTFLPAAWLVVRRVPGNADDLRLSAKL